MRMINIIIGFAIGAAVASNYDLRPFYENTIKPNVEAGLEKVKEVIQTPPLPSNNDEKKK